jgi:hypothetical protein
MGGIKIVSCRLLCLSAARYYPPTNFLCSMLLCSVSIRTVLDVVFLAVIILENNL